MVCWLMCSMCLFDERSLIKGESVSRSADAANRLPDG